MSSTAVPPMLLVDAAIVCSTSDAMLSSWIGSCQALPFATPTSHRTFTGTCESCVCMLMCVMHS